jgi:DNA-binding PadR family transcriptional regulator
MIDYALLGLLAKQRDHGYRLKRRFEDQMGPVWTLNVGQVYQTLHQLQARGLVAEVPDAAPPGRRRRRLFDVTPKGRRALERWLRRPPAAFRPARDETLVRLLVLQADRSSNASEQLRRQEDLHREVRRRLRLHATSLVGEGERAVARLAIDAALLHVEAHLEWLGRCRRHLEEPTAPAFASRAAAG